MTSSGCPHLAAEPVTVRLMVNLHDDVIHLCDPHKPVALQEPGREHSSVLGLRGLLSRGPNHRGDRCSRPAPAAQGRKWGPHIEAPINTSVRGPGINWQSSGT